MLTRIAFRSLASCLATGFLLLACAHPAGAVIKAPENPVRKIYDDFSQTVVVGRITRVAPATSSFEVKTEQVLKGTMGDSFIVSIKPAAARNPELLKEAAEGKTVVLFAAKDPLKPDSALHFGDTWLQAKQTKVGGPWLAMGVVQLNRKSFPGSTADLARVVEAIKAGKPALIDAYAGQPFHGGAKELAKVNVTKPTSLTAITQAAGGKPSLLVDAADGVHLFVPNAAGYQDMTEQYGLAGAPADARPAVGDVNGDGKPDLLIGKTLWINDGQKFAAAKAPLDLPAGAKPIASAQIDVTGDGKPDAVFLLSDGTVLAFENPGSPDKPWPKQPERRLPLTGAASAAAIADWSGDGKPSAMVASESGLTCYALTGDRPPADFERLTADKLDAAVKAWSGGLKSAAVVPIEINGDGRPDLLLSAEGGAVLLINRGFGAFLADADAGKALPFPLTPATAATAADLHGGGAGGAQDLLVLTEDGKLLAAENPRDAEKAGKTPEKEGR